MESLGEKLRTAREKLGYTLEQIARDTHIARRYLSAMEEEDFSLFPAETYLKGFLQNYAEYLGLNAEEILLMYRNMRIQEQPIPLEQLLEKRSSKRRPLLIGSLLALALLIIGLIVILIVLRPWERFFNASPVSVSPAPEGIVFNGQKISVNLGKGLAIKTKQGAKAYDLSLEFIEENKISLSTPEGLVSLIIGEEKFFDLDRDGVMDLSVFLTGILKEDSQLKAQLTLQKPDSSLNLSRVSDLDLIERGIAKVISEKAQPAPFVIEISFNKNCFIIYYLDKNDRVEKLVAKGEKLSLTAERTVALRFSDSSAITMSIDSVNLIPDTSNQFYACQLRWVKTGEDKNTLAVFTQE